MLAKSTEPSAAHQLPKQITECQWFEYLNKKFMKNHLFLLPSLYSNTKRQHEEHRGQPPASQQVSRAAKTTEIMMEVE